VSGQYILLSAFELRMVGAPVCVKNCNAAGFITLNSFPYVSRMVHHPKGHPANLTQLKVLESTTSANIPVDTLDTFDTLLF
jgi:hypothetical protein